jgi:hypothetical protein
MTDQPQSLRTPEVRFGQFPKFFEKGLANDKGDSFYECDLLISPEQQKTPEYAGLVAAAKAAMKEKFPSGAPEGARSPFRKASAKQRTKDGSSYYPEEDFPGYVMLSVKSKNQPGVVGATVDPATGKLVKLETGDITGGDYGRVTVHPFAYSVKGNAGVSFWMNNVQKTRSGDPLGGGGARADDDFAPVGDAAGADVDAMFAD